MAWASGSRAEGSRQDQVSAGGGMAGKAALWVGDREGKEGNRKLGRQRDKQSVGPWIEQTAE